MTTAVRTQFSLIRNLAVIIHLVNATSYSMKAGATNSAPIVAYNLLQLSTIYQYHVGYGPELTDDTHRLAVLIHPPNRMPVVVGNEGDVRRFYSRYISHLLTLACPKLQERAETGPIQQSTLSTTIDSRFTFNNHQALIVELKKPGTINEQEWRGQANTSSRRNLSKEIRM